MSNAEVARFMVGVSLDATALKRFHKDPDAEMRRYGISAEAAKVIKSRDASAIHKAIMDDYGAAADGDTIVNIVVVVMP